MSDEAKSATNGAAGNVAVPDDASLAGYRAMFEHNPQPMWVYSLDDLYYLAVNEAAVRRYGYTREEFLAMKLTDVRPPEDVPGFLKTFNVARALPFYDAFSRHRAKDGSLFDVHILAYDLPFAGKRARLALITDLTDKRRAESALRESEARFRALAETAASAIFIYQGPKFRYVNRAAEDVTGYTREELLKLNFWDVVHPDHRDMIQQRGLARQRGEYVPPRYEFKIVRKDGEARWVDFTSGVIDFQGSIAALGTAFDITERKVAEEALTTSESRFRALVEYSGDVVCLVSADGTTTWTGPSTSSILGYHEQEVVGRSLLAIVHPDDTGRAAHFVETALSRRLSPVLVEFRLQRKDGSWLWFEVTGKNLFEDPAVGAIVVNCRDITERKLVEDQMRYQALHDVLTDLPNRMLFEDRLALAIAHAERHRTQLAVIFLDLDLFKLINDTLGHRLGDRLLIEVAKRLAHSLRVTDTVARVGGDEFTIILEDIDSEEHAAKLADKLLRSLADPFFLEGHQLYLTASLGISFFPADGHDADTLIKNADNAMYRAKEVGRNNVQLFTPSMNERYRNRLKMEEDLRHAVEREQFELLYQPIFTVDGKVAGAEALLRWNHPERGVVGPDEFIPLAEDTRQIIPIGKWVLRTACRQWNEWQAEGLGRMRLGVNLSVRQFHQTHLLDMIDAAIEESGIDPACLELEITETIAMQNAELTHAILQSLRHRNIGIAIDDFGAGQSSLIYLRQFPITTIKIDRVFIRNVACTDADNAIVSAIIALAHSLGLCVVAEGVESEQQADFLRAQRCDLMQGYYFARPMPVREFRSMLSSATAR